MHTNNDGILTYSPGEQVTLTAKFTGADGTTPTNPTGLTFYYINPATGVTTTVAKASLTNPTTGTWTYGLTAPDHGIWRWGAVATGAVAEVAETYFYVIRSLLFLDA